MIRRQGANYTVLAIFSDILCTIAALTIAGTLRTTLPFGADILSDVIVPPSLIILAPLIWFAVFLTLGVYDPRHTAHFLAEIRRVLSASFFAVLVLSGALYFTDREVSRLLVIYLTTLDIALRVLWRFIIHALFNGRRAKACRVLIVGSGNLAEQIVETLRSHTWTSIQIVGFVDSGEATLLDLPRLGSLAEAAHLVKKHAVNEVVIALPYRDYECLNALVPELQRLPVQVRIAPNYLNLVLYRATAEEFGGVPLINLRAPALNAYQRVVKRSFDLIVGTLTLILAAPLWAILWLAIRLDSKGPVIFKQERIGENGKPFIMYKFRTMYLDAEARQAEVLHYDENGNLIHKRADDPRVTRIGRFLRRTSLDELPNLINVLRGEMSLVGPRPEVAWMLDKYQTWQLKRFAVPQGMTGWWQINGRSTKPMHLHTEDDLYYIQNYSILLDLYILWRTLFVVLSGKGAF
ncbi:MAG: sugar transferase [Candidatus Thermofonsia Clade 1 bacterium]|uniref:Sugar transferase n=1 Tax=Candidatus Thermofonsia Clade 1 bacterium TaxID=2364210 RepID=A0A2M8P2T2_9CHLR|nr:MAG: sugar transferase [Candidatus Thermofonsia Clade 1 bacterium]